MGHDELTLKVNNN